MQLMKMTYKNFEFNGNPSSIKVTLNKNIAVQNVLLQSKKATQISTEPVVITGSGAFYGSDSPTKAFELQKVFNSKGSSYLFIPSYSPINCCFKKLVFDFNSLSNGIKYDFMFIEDSNNKLSEYDFGYTYAKKGENLFDIANRTGIDIEEIVLSNRFKDVFCVNEGDRVNLC